MELDILIESFIGLVSLLGVLFLFLFLNIKKKKKLKDTSSEKTEKENLQALLQVIQGKATSTQELQSIVEKVLQDFGLIDEENFTLYGQILLKTARHPNSNKKTILALDRGLSKRNPKYAKEIDKFTSQGLNSREV